MNPVLAIGLNPAWQKTLTFASFQAGTVNRASEVRSGASGKGINFIRAAQRWGVEARVLQLVGGDTGRRLCRELAREGLEHRSVRVVGATRTCTTCLDVATGTMTELIEPAGAVTAAAVRRLRRLAMTEMAGAAGVALCGTFPPGVSPGLYADLARAATARGLPVLLDAWCAVEPTLAAGITMLKINRAELASLVGEGDLPEMSQACLARYPVQVVAVTDGPGEAWLATRQQAWRFVLPLLPQVSSPLGAGDTVAAVFFGEYLAGTALPKAFAAGLAAGTVSCLSPEPAEFSREQAVAMMATIRPQLVTG